MKRGVTTLEVVLLVAVLGLAAVLGVVLMGGGNGNPGGDNSGPGDGPSQTGLGQDTSETRDPGPAAAREGGRSLTRKPLEPEATKRLATGPQVISTTFQATGSGVWKKFGGKVTCRYLFTAVVRAESTIGNVKKETARGNFEVTEIRKFIEARENLRVTETDVGLALCETLPVDAVAQSVAGIGAFVSMFDGGATLGTSAKVYETIKSIDGQSLRGLCKMFGVAMPEEIEGMVEKVSTDFANGKLENVRNRIRSIEGKSYKIVYVQDKEGVPLRVDFTNVDGSPIAEDEWEILRLANVFIDAQVIPDKRVQPGDRWEIDAETLAALVDPVAEGGSCEGKVAVERKDDLSNGDWELHFHPATVTTRSDGGATAGVFKIKDGNAIGDRDNAYVKSMQLNGTGRLGRTKKTKRWEIFNFMEKIGGDCEFRAFMTTDRKD